MTRHFSRRAILKTSLMAGIGVGLTACAGTPAAPTATTVSSGATTAPTTTGSTSAPTVRPTTPAAQPAATAAPAAKKLSGEVVWYVRSNAVENQWQNELAIPAFAKVQPDITITLNPASNAEFDTKLTSLIASGSPPDVWTHWGTAGFGDYFARDLLSDLSPYVQRDGLQLADYTSGVHEPWKRDGKYYALSFNQRFGSFVFYNKDAFDAAGIALPPTDWNDKSWTWERLVEAARKLTQDKGGGDIVWGFRTSGQQGDLNLAYMFGGDHFTDEHYATGVAPNTTIDSKPAIDGFQARHDLHYRDRVFPTAADMQGWPSGDPFVNGKYAMSLEGGWGWANFTAVKNFTWRVAPLPWGVTNRNVNYINPWMLSKESKAKDQSWELIKFLITEDGQRTLVASGFQPTLTRLIDEWAKRFEPQMTPAEVKQLTIGAAERAKVSPNQLFVDYNRIYQAYNEPLQALWKNETAVSTAVQNAKQQADRVSKEVYDQYKKS